MFNLKRIVWRKLLKLKSKKKNIDLSAKYKADHNLLYL